MFAVLATRVEPGPGLLWRAWLLAAAVTALLNLDAAVVILTPLYLRVADRTGTDRLTLAAIPVLQASLASSPLPVSNLTNLIVEGAHGVGATAFARELGPASLVAVGVGWLAFRRRECRRRDRAGVTAAPSGTPIGVAALPPAETRVTTAARDGGRSGTLSLLGGIVAVTCAVGFAAGEVVGLASWQVALGGVVVLAVACRCLPWRAMPIDAAGLVLGLGILIPAAVPPLTLADGAGPAVQAGGVVAGVLGATLANNLPALLAVLPGLSFDGGGAGWAYLLGVNMGPVLVLWASLAALLWLHSCHQMGLVITAYDYHRLGWRVGAPALLAATVARVAQTVLLV